ncbi:hypothetical protein AIF0345_1161 [Actinomyces israelii]|nr:hypothetical protein AIF0345_1161 [Actinomyces israelii]
MSWVEGLDCRGGGGVLWAGSLGWWGLGQEMGEGTARSPWAPRSVRSGRLRAGGWAPGWERPGLGGGLGEKRLPSFAQGVPVGARARTCVRRGGQASGRSPWCAAACARRGLPPPASRESRWVGDIHLYPHPGRCSICLATVPGLLHEESSRGRHWDDHTRHRPLVCEAIGMAARRRPHATGGDDPPRPGPAAPWHTPRPARRPPGGPRSSPSGRAGPGRAGRAPGRKLAGATLKEREGLSDGPPPQEARPSGTPPPLRPSPEQARNTRSETAPPRPEGTGHPARPTRSTEQQDKQPETPPSELSETRPAAQ